MMTLTSLAWKRPLSNDQLSLAALTTDMCMRLFVFKWFSQWRQFHWFTSLPVYLHGVSLSCDSYVDLRPLKCCSASFTKASWSTPGNNSTIFLNLSKVLQTNSRRGKRRIWVLIINSWLTIWLFVTINFPKVTVEKKYMLSKEWLHCKEEGDEDRYQYML